MDILQIIKDKDCKINVNGIISLINAKTKQLKIKLIDDNYDFNEKLIIFPKTHKKHFKDFKNIVTDQSFTIIVTDCPYDNSYFFEDYNNFIILSFYDWEVLTTLPKENGLLYWLCDLGLAEFQEQFTRHYQTTGCLNDFLGDKTGIDLGMRQASLCANCLNDLHKSKISKEKEELLNDIQSLLDHLSQKSRWNKNILEHDLILPKPKFTKRKTLKKGELNLLIASPSDVAKEREILLNYLERNFRTVGYEKSLGLRLITNGWEELPSQTGYGQDIINDLVLPRIDIVIGILKHKLGTPTKDEAGKIRAESGTAEEIYYAIEKNPSTVLCMLYVFSKAPSPSFDDVGYEQIKENWDRVQAFRTKIQSKVLYKTYSTESELLDLVTKDIAKNVETYFK